MPMELVIAKIILKETNVRSASPDSSNIPIVSVKFEKRKVSQNTRCIDVFQNVNVLRMEQWIVHVMIRVRVPVRTE